ncbi:MAG: hypothetical protein RSA17_01450 [Ruthenibacterium sp.]
MRLFIFAPGLANRHEIAHAISIQAEDFYNGVGKCTLVLPLDSHNAALARKNSVLYIADKKLSYDIDEVLTDVDQRAITLNGRAICNRLNRRGVIAPAVITQVEAGVYAAVQANLRGLEVSLLAAAGLSGTVNATTLYGGNLLTAIMPLLDSVGFGQRAVLDYTAKVVTWGIYKGVDRTAGMHRVVFSEERGTAPGLVIDDDISAYKNVCYCSAKYASGAEFVACAGAAEGDARREMWADYSGDAQAETESNAAFFARVAQYAALQLYGTKDRCGFTVNIDGTELGKAYNVGDFVCCVSLRSGVQFNARITSANFSQDVNGQSTKLTLGDPTLTILGG